MTVFLFQPCKRRGEERVAFFYLKKQLKQQPTNYIYYIASIEYDVT